MRIQEVWVGREVPLVNGGTVKITVNAQNNSGASISDAVKVLDAEIKIEVARLQQEALGGLSEAKVTTVETAPVAEPTVIQEPASPTVKKTRKKKAKKAAPKKEEVVDEVTPAVEPVAKSAETMQSLLKIFYIQYTAANGENSIDEITAAHQTSEAQKAALEGAMLRWLELVAGVSEAAFQTMSEAELQALLATMYAGSPGLKEQVDAIDITE